MIDHNSIHSASQLANLIQKEEQENAAAVRTAVLYQAPEKAVEAKNVSGPKRKLKKGTQIHTAFDSYVLINQIGQGGNGRVFAAETENNESVAIKFIEKNKDHEKLKRFKNEIHFCEKYQHKNIVPILDRGYVSLDDRDYAFYVMPLFEQTLKDKIAAGLSPDAAVNIFIGIIEGLRFAHQHGTIHRDIKPENILFLKNSDDPVICDFGIAHFAEEDLQTTILTKDSDRLCNFKYCAPEQKSPGQEVSGQTDIYSAALILNEMFTKTVPQAPGYKHIADVNPEYKYLDDVFEMIYHQDPADRLYPEEKIISEIKLRAEKYQHEHEILLLKQCQKSFSEPEQFIANIIYKKFIDNELIFEFDQSLPHDWIFLMKQGAGDYEFLPGYEPDNIIALRKNNRIAMPLREFESEDTIKKLVRIIKSWVVKTNLLYNQKKRADALDQVRIEEQQRKEQIEQIEKENRLNMLLDEL